MGPAIEMNSSVIIPDCDPDAKSDQRDDNGVNTAKHFRRQPAVDLFAEQSARGGTSDGDGRHEQRNLAGDQFADEACGRIHQGDE